MNKSIEVQAKTVEEAVEKGLKELNTTIENVDIEILSEAKSGFLSFGSHLAKVRLILLNNNGQQKNKQSNNDSKIVLDVFNKIISYMGFNVKPDIVELENKFRLIIKDTNDASLLIGKNGKTIESLQILMNKILRKKHIRKMVYIDIKGYVIQKQKNKKNKWKKKQYSHK